MLYLAVLGMLMGDGVVRLEPRSFPELPEKVVVELERRGCKVPQGTGTKQRMNVVQGEFREKGQMDWAVLCSVRGVSRVLVFWNGEVDGVVALGKRKDTVGDEGYTRYIGVADEAFMKVHWMTVHGPREPRFEHQGINDGEGMGSSVWYFSKGKWTVLPGAD